MMTITGFGVSFGIALLLFMPVLDALVLDGAHGVDAGVDIAGFVTIAGASPVGPGLITSTV